MTTHEIPTKEQIEQYLEQRRNWGRWGDKSGAGAINLITAEKRVAAARLIRSGRAISLSRPFPVTPSPENPRPAHHFMGEGKTPGGGTWATDYIGVAYHGLATTHIDALCHVYQHGYMWDGRDPSKEITFDGATFGSVDEWSDGIITRGVLLDVPKHRGKPYVTAQEPVHGWELEEIAKGQGVTVEPGDALLVYSGRDAFSADYPGGWGGQAEKPGLHTSCLPFIRENDIAVLGWDMMDATPNPYGLAWSVHAAIFAFGVALLDNSLLQPLAQACSEEGRYEFLLTINPLNVIGGTGSPVNPIAMF